MRVGDVQHFVYLLVGLQDHMLQLALPRLTFKQINNHTNKTVSQ